MGFLFLDMTTRNLLSVFLFCSGIAFAQAPEWTNIAKNSIGPGYYSGIGISSASQSDADNRAFVEFGRSVQVMVKSVFQREVSEEEKSFSDKTTISTEMISNVSLKGITVTERYHSVTDSLYYSLIKYAVAEYDSTVLNEVRREIAMLKVRNQMEEERKQEELRAVKAKNALDEQKTKEELRTNQERITFEQQRQKQEEEAKALHQKMYGEFLAVPAPERAVTLRTAELSTQGNSLLVTGGFGPFQLSGLRYAMRLAMFEVSASATARDYTLLQQDAYLRVRIIPGVGEFTKTTVTIGVVQSVGAPKDSVFTFDHALISFYAAANLTIPEYWYSTFLLTGEKRKIGAGWITYPFYPQLKQHVGFSLEAVTILDKAYRNSRNEKFVINGALRVQASPDFITMLSFEQHERLKLSMEFQF